MDREIFLYTQIAGERLAYKTMGLTGKTKLKLPNVEDMTRRYIKLYDDIENAIEKIDGED